MSQSVNGSDSSAISLELIHELVQGDHRRRKRVVEGLLNRRRAEVALFFGVDV